MGLKITIHTEIAGVANIANLSGIFFASPFGVISPNICIVDGR